MSMSMCNGLEIRKSSSIPIIAITAGSLDEDRDRAILAGMNDFILKPLNSYELYEVLKRQLSKKRATISNDADIFDRAELLYNLNQDEDTLQELITLSHSNIDKQLSQLSTALQEGNDSAALSTLHSLKGSAANMRYKLLAEHIKDFERNYPKLDKDMRLALFRRAQELWQEVLAIS